MQIILNIVLLLAGFVLLVKGADVFVDGAVGISRRLKIPAVVVGLTIVAFGTSAPEAAVSIAAAISGSNGIAAGNIVGSNMFNLLVVTGISAIFMALPVSKSILKKDFPFMMAITFALFFMFFDGGALFGGESVLSRGDGLILLIFFVIFLVYTVRGALESRNSDETDSTEVSGSLLKNIIFIVGSVAAIVVGGELVVRNASDIATALGMSETLVGLTIVACGTSLPELVTSIVASRKGENDIAIGNVVGSNIFNIGLVLGLSSAINPIAIDGGIVIDTAILLGISMLIAIPIYKNKKLSVGSGIFMVLFYAAYLAYIIFRNYAGGAI